MSVQFRCVCALVQQIWCRYDKVQCSSPFNSSSSKQTFQSVILQAASETTEGQRPVDRFRRAECATAYMVPDEDASVA